MALSNEEFARMFPHLRQVSAAELERDHGDIIRNEFHRIEKWPDFEFTTADGRRFGIFIDTVASIEHKFHAAGVLVNAHDKERLSRTSGFILEIGSSEPPFVYEEYEELAAKWIGHHDLYDVRLTDEEKEIFEIDDEDEE